MMRIASDFVQYLDEAQEVPVDKKSPKCLRQRAVARKKAFKLNCLGRILWLAQAPAESLMMTRTSRHKCRWGLRW